MVDTAATPGAQDVLSQPTRARLFALLQTLKRPAQTTELAEALELHPNGVRIHLERMEQAGLVRRARVRNRRGRPPDTWTIAPEARPGGDAPRAYRDLGRWLVRALGAGPATPETIEETGRQIGREIAPCDADASVDIEAGVDAEGVDAEAGVDAFLTALSALGFAPSAADRDGDRVSVCLRNCPYADAVHESQSVVCGLHRGLTRGLLERIEPGAALSGFTPRDPDEAGCMIELRVGPTAT